MVVAIQTEKRDSNRVRDNGSSKAGSMRGKPTTNKLLRDHRAACLQVGNSSNTS